MMLGRITAPATTPADFLTNSLLDDFSFILFYFT
jgi:hypothetical protein